MPGAAYRRFLDRLEAARTLGVDLGLDRVRLALSRMGEPHRRFASVQIAGTNGKGSTAAMTDRILRAAGVRTGLYTSPHLARFTERIRVDGAEVDGDRLDALCDRVQATGVPLTYFEIATLLALGCFAEDGVEAAVLETGLGGRLDAVTAVDPVATAITSIALDHTDLLGTTLTEIAREKAGIAKAGVPLYVGQMPAEALREVTACAAQVGAPLHRPVARALAPALAGAHQVGNAALAVALAGDLTRTLGRALPAAAVAEGLARVSWPGRMEWAAPEVLLDAAHNGEGARALVAALPPRHPRVLLVSVVRGKDAADILAVLAPAFDRVIATQSRNPRSLSAPVLADLLPAGTAHEIIPDAALALRRAGEVAGGEPGGPTGGYTVVAGSIFLVGEVRAILLGEPVDPLSGGDPLP